MPAILATLRRVVALIRAEIATPSGQEKQLLAAWAIDVVEVAK